MGAVGTDRDWMAVGVVTVLLVGAIAWRPLVGAESMHTLRAEPWSTGRVAALRGEGRGVFVNFTAAWCVTCKVNEGAALSSPAIAQAFADENIAYLKGDWTNRDEAIAAELAAHGRAGVPLYLYFPADGSPPRVLPQLLSEGLILNVIAGGSP
jgi:thiol:disulfide interchange protein